MRALPYLFLILFSANVAWAQIQITGVSRASGYSLSTSTSSTPEIYGGISGDGDLCTGLGSDEYCNTCVDPDVSCNRKRIHDDLELTITFKVIDDISGEIIVGFGDSDADNTLDTDDYSRTSGSLSKNSEGTVRIPWGEICDMFTAVHGGDPCQSVVYGGTTDLTNNDIALFIGLGSDIDETSKRTKITVKIIEPDFIGAMAPHLYQLNAPSPDVGLDAFVAVPGDEKIYIDQLDPSPDCPDTGSSEVEKFRIFYSATDFAGANYDSSNFKDFSIDDDCDPQGDWVIEGLTNGAYYHVRAAILDAAQNVAFLGDSTIYSACADPVANDGDDATCVYAAKPDNVLGLLNEDFNCFIATATFGSGFHTFVRTLRMFRNKVLLPHRLGRDFIRWYYKVGPTAAKWISDKPKVKTAVGVVLTPITALAWFSIHYGLLSTILLLLCAIFALGYYSHQYRQQKALAKIKKQQRGNSHDKN